MEVDSILAKMHSLEEGLRSANPARVREMLRRLVNRVELSFEKTGAGCCKWLLSKGLVVFDCDLTLVSNGFPETTETFTK